VVSTGVFTIPIMGVIAFLMADVTGIPYLQIVLAKILLRDFVSHICPASVNTRQTWVNHL